MKDLIANFNLNETICQNYFNDTNIIDIIPKINEIIIQIGKSLENDYIEVKKNVWINKSAEVFPSAYIESPCIIDANTIIRHNAYIRGNVIIGKNCVIGNSTELKNCIIFNNVQLPHFNYVGDSIIGYKSHLGAGAIISNFKSDKSRINIYDKSFKKLGAIIGDNVEIGCNSVIYPGTIIKRNSTIYPLTRIKGIIEQDSIVKENETIKKKIIYLDFDSTIYDTDKLFKDILNILEQNKINIDEIIEKKNQISKEHKVFNIYKLLDSLDYDVDIKIIDNIKRLIKDKEYIFNDVYEAIKMLRDKKYQVNILTFGDEEFQLEKINSCRLKEYIDEIIITNKDKTTLDFIDYKNGIFFDDNIEMLEGFNSKHAKQIIRIKRKNTSNYNKILKIKEIYEFENLLDSIKLF